MKRISSGKCPLCDEKLKIIRLACPQCKSEFPIEESLSSYDYLSDDNAKFLKTFLICRGNMKQVEKVLNVSYPTAKKRLDELLFALGYMEKMEEEIDMSLFMKPDSNSTRASDVIRTKLYENGGQAIVSSARGNNYLIKFANNGKSFLCDQLPITPPYEYSVFDVIVDLLLKSNGKARKGNGRNYRLGYGDCTEDTVVGAIALNYAGKNIGDSVFDPVFVLVAVLEWANIAHNRRGYIELTQDYRLRLEN